MSKYHNQPLRKCEDVMIRYKRDALLHVYAIQSSACITIIIVLYSRFTTLKQTKRQSRSDSECEQ